QFPVHRATFLPHRERPVGGTTAGCRLSGHHYRLLGCVGGRRWPLDVGARRRDELRQGPTRTGRRGQPRLPVRAVPRHQRAQRPRGGRPVTAATLIGPDELTTTALAASKADGAIVVLTDTSEVNLRWANNTMTTNGHTTTRSFSVISVIGEA